MALALALASACGAVGDCDADAESMSTYWSGCGEETDDAGDGDERRWPLERSASQKLEWSRGQRRSEERTRSSALLPAAAMAELMQILAEAHAPQVAGGAERLRGERWRLYSCR